MMEVQWAWACMATWSVPERGGNSEVESARRQLEKEKKGERGNHEKGRGGAGRLRRIEERECKRGPLLFFNAPHDWD